MTYYLHRPKSIYDNISDIFILIQLVSSEVARITNIGMLSGSVISAFHAPLDLLLADNTR